MQQDCSSDSSEFTSVLKIRKDKEMEYGKHVKNCEHHRIDVVKSRGLEHH